MEGFEQSLDVLGHYNMGITCTLLKFLSTKKIIKHVSLKASILI